MKVHITTEFHEMVPPLMFAQAQQAIARVLESYGWRPSITVDRSQMSDAEQRYWDWVRREQDGG